MHNYSGKLQQFGLKLGNKIVKLSLFIIRPEAKKANDTLKYVLRNSHMI